MIVRCPRIDYCVLHAASNPDDPQPAGDTMYVVPNVRKGSEAVLAANAGYDTSLMTIRLPCASAADLHDPF